MCDTLNILYSLSIISLWKEKHTLCEEKNAKHSSRNCQYISLVMPPSFRGKAELGTRERPSSSKNMPFLHVEDAFLEARRASSLCVLVTYWFIVGYKRNYREFHTPTLKEYSSTQCNDILRFYWLCLDMEWLLRFFIEEVFLPSCHQTQKSQKTDT